MARIEITTEACKSCSYCVISCPKKCLEIGSDVNSKGYLYAVSARPKDCIGCAMCAQICPESAIEVWR
jgi:2-oxoglutarate ferredoxin oxidoreductase subunit delta